MISAISSDKREKYILSMHRVRIHRAIGLPQLHNVYLTIQFSTTFTRITLYKHTHDVFPQFAKFPTLNRDKLASKKPLSQHSTTILPNSTFQFAHASKKQKKKKQTKLSKIRKKSTSSFVQQSRPNYHSANQPRKKDTPRWHR